MPKKYYWLYLEPYVYLSVKRNKILLYNPLNGKILQYSNNFPLLKKIRRLTSSKNVYVLKLSERDWADPSISKFVTSLRKYFMGDIIERLCSDGKPFQMMPILKIRKDFDKLKNQYISPTIEDIMVYLSEISIFVNNRCDHNCAICTHAYRQFLFCHKCNYKSEELSMGTIKRFFREASGSSLKRCFILGGNIFEHAEFEKLVILLYSLKTENIFYTSYLNVDSKYENYLGLLKNNKSRLNILVHFPFDLKKISLSLNLIEKTGVDSNFDIVVEKDEDIEFVEELTSECVINNYSVRPYFNKKNLAFFKKAVFLRKSDILESNPNQEELFSRMAINPLNFGRISVLSSGNVFANVNLPKLGNINKNSLYEMLYKEMLKGKSWRLTRKKVEPCKYCTFDALCPPISNYELVIGRYNLCHIKG